MRLFSLFFCMLLSLHSKSDEDERLFLFHPLQAGEHIETALFKPYRGTLSMTTAPQQEAIPYTVRITATHSTHTIHIRVNPEFMATDIVKTQSAYLQQASSFVDNDVFSIGSGRASKQLNLNHEVIESSPAIENDCMHLTPTLSIHKKKKSLILFFLNRLLFPSKNYLQHMHPASLNHTSIAIYGKTKTDEWHKLFLRNEIFEISLSEESALVDISLAWDTSDKFDPVNNQSAIQFQRADNIPIAIFFVPILAALSLELNELPKYCGFLKKKVQGTVMHLHSFKSNKSTVCEVLQDKNNKLQAFSIVDRDKHTSFWRHNLHYDNQLNTN